MRLKTDAICLLQVAARQTGIHEPFLAQNDGVQRQMACWQHLYSMRRRKWLEGHGTALGSLCTQLEAQSLREHRCPPDCGLDTATPGLR